MNQSPGKYCRALAAKVLMPMVVVLFLHGCSTKHAVQYPSGPEPAPLPSPRPRPVPAPTPAPVPTPVPAPVPDAVPDPVPDSGLEAAPESSPATGRESVPVAVEGKAAGALLASARQNVRAGEFSQAEIMLERALRVEPRNARLWHEMAQVKYSQKDYGQAVQFCIKSNSLAGKDYSLMQQNWLLMEKAYTELGEPEKAQQVRIKAG